MDTLINTVGLCFDILGVIMLFRFGLPSRVREGGRVSLVVGVSKELERAHKTFKLFSYIGLACLVFGFFLQIVSNYV